MTEIVVSQRVDASPAAVYRCLTESRLWTRWHGAVTAGLNPVEGGIFSMSMPNGMMARGRFVELVPDRRVVFTWGWVDRPGIPPGSTIVEIDLEQEGEGTMVVLTHRNLPDDEAPLHREGWEDRLPDLATLAAGEAA